MPASGSSIFTDAESYQTSVGDLLDLVVPQPRAFKVRLTRVDLPILGLLRAQESAARVGLLRLPSDLVFVTFPTQATPQMVVSGIKLQFGDVWLHPPGEILHQRTSGASEWGAISLTPAALLEYGRILLDRDLAVPAAGGLLRLAFRKRQALLHAHRQAVRLAETHLHRITHPEVARAQQDDLLRALIAALGSGRALPDQPLKRRDAALVLRFTGMLDDQLRLLRINDICSSLSVSQQALRLSCHEVLGMGPARYQLLWQLKRVRQDLMRGKPAEGSGPEVLMRYGFGSLPHLVMAYWRTYGEMPPIAPHADG